MVMSLYDARRILEVQSPYKVPDAKKDIDGELYEEVDLGKGDSDFSGAKLRWGCACTCSDKELL